MSKSRLFAAAALVAAGTFGVGVAQAQETRVSWSITIGTPIAVLPAPVVVRPAPVIVPAVPYGYPHAYRQPTRWDVDGDGIPNRYDRVYNPAWDRDGDGIPNQRDPYDNRRHDRH